MSSKTDSKTNTNYEAFENILEVQGINAKGFGIIAKLVMLDQRLTIEAKAIYSYFCSYAGNGTSAFPSVQKIVHDLCIRKTRYYKHFNLLVDLGYIKVTKNRQEGNKFANNIYTLVSNPVTNKEPQKPCTSFEDTETKNPCIDFEDTETKNPCIDFGDTENRYTNINNYNKNIINNNNNTHAHDSNIFNDKDLNAIANSFSEEVKEVIKAFKDTTSEKIVPSVLNSLNDLVAKHGYEFVNHAITRANKDINVNYLIKALNSSSYVNKKTIEEVEQAISKYNAPKTRSKQARSKAIRTELVPDWLNKSDDNTEYVGSPTTTHTTTIKLTNADPSKQDLNVKSKTIEAIVNDFKYAPYDTIMFNVEKAGYDRNDINVINEVMSLI